MNNLARATGDLCLNMMRGRRRRHAPHLALQPTPITLLSTMTTMVDLLRQNKLQRSERTREEDQLVELEEDVPDLRSLVLPWASMVIVAVIATLVVLYNNRCDEERSELQYYASSFFDSSEISDGGSSSNDSILERLLSTVTVEHHHVHKPVFEENHPPLFPLSVADQMGFSLAIIGLMIAAGGGIGGGGILVPIYILVMGFTPKHGKYPSRFLNDV